MKTLSSKTFDLIIAGGGTAGTLSALAAARDGLSVLIIESSPFLGGMSTCSGLTEMNAAGYNGFPIYGGIEKEIFEEMMSSGFASLDIAVPMSSNRNIKIDRMRYNPELLKLLFERKAIESGIEILYNTNVIYVEEKKDSIFLKAQSLYSTLNLKCRFLIDSTGNASIVTQAGYETIKTKNGRQLIATQVFRLSNVDTKVLNEYILNDEITELVDKGIQEGKLKGKILGFAPIPNTNDVSLNVTRSSFDYEDVYSTSKGMLEARSQIKDVLEFVKENIPGTKNCYISNISPMMGIRDSRRIVGEYTLTINDLESMFDFEDTIAIGCYPMDIHDPVTNTVIWKVLPGMYNIPFRSLIPRGSKRIIVAGRCLSADKEAFGAIRVMPIMMNVGESAGYSISYSIKNGLTLNEVNCRELRHYLRGKNLKEELNGTNCIINYFCCINGIRYSCGFYYDRLINSIHIT